MKIVLITLIIAIAIVEIWVAFRLRNWWKRLDQLIKYTEARQDAVREAMRRNGDTARELNTEKRVLEERSKAVERRNVAAMEKWSQNAELEADIRDEIQNFRNATQVTVEYRVTNLDRESYAENKIPAVVKSRIANKLGHRILRMLPDALRRMDVCGEDIFKVDVFVKSKLEKQP